MCDLTSMCLEIFLSVVDFSFDSNMVREHTLCGFFKKIILDLLGFILWASIWSILVNVHGPFKNSVHPAIVGWHVL